MNSQDYQDFKTKNFPAIVKEDRIPGETVLYYGKDQKEKSTIPESMSLHLKPDTDWNQHTIEYTWNSLGYRGPEPDYSAKHKILFAGGSLLVGCGLPLEGIIPELIVQHYGADYLNISDYDSLTALVDPLRDVGVNYDPDIVIIGDTRFVAENNWLMAYIKTNLKRGNLNIGNQELQFFNETFNKTNNDILKIFEGYVNHLFPRAKVIFLIAPRKNFKFENDIENKVTITRDMMIDLSRDNVHPGFKTHQVIAQKLIEAIDEK